MHLCNCIWQDSLASSGGFAPNRFRLPRGHSQKNRCWRARLRPTWPLNTRLSSSSRIPLLSALIERTILSRIPECRLLWARTIEEAHVRSFGLKIALFVLDVELPDGNGLDFLLEMRQTQPAARAIVSRPRNFPSRMLTRRRWVFCGSCTNPSKRRIWP